MKNKLVTYLTGQVVAAYTGTIVGNAYMRSLLREPPQGRDFAKLNLHLPAYRSLGAGRAIFEQPGIAYLFSDLMNGK